MPKRLLSTRGMSLLEILVAVTLVAVGSLAAVTMQEQSTKSNQGTYSREAAASLARQLLEAVDSLPYSSACLTAGGSYGSPCATVSASNPLNAQGQTVAAGGYTRTWRITNNGGGTANNANFKTVQVRVTWNDRGQNQLDMTTYKGWASP